MDSSAVSQDERVSRSRRSGADLRILIRARIAMGFATFFDGFDVLTIAYVLPVIAPLWKLSAGQIGALISVGFAGQFFGAILFGRLAERIGRVQTALLTITLFSLASVGCAATSGYESLIAMRFIQGIGLGGEMPVAAAYISEISPTKARGRFFLLYELVFPIGMLAAGIAGMMLVPVLGWQSMFVLGAAPAPLLLFVRRGLPESPRWLASVGRSEEAQAMLARLEERDFDGGAEAQPYIELSGSLIQDKGTWRDLFKGRYRKRTVVVWLLWVFTYFITYGLTSWLPTICRSQFHFSLKQSFGFSVATGVAGLIGAALCALLVDQVGRRKWFVAAFLTGALWLGGLAMSNFRGGWGTQILVAASYMCIASNAMLLYLYTPEIYPTKFRAFGVGMATAWLRIASTFAPLLVPPVLEAFGVRGVFALFGICAAFGTVISIFATETSGVDLEELSPLV